ncbi:geranylgeranylglyceryl/heptaprenylglyceryl phosphate synthase [Flavobacterium sp.]|uniref:geranylgeranylglyceryl/heptaprenylglyceryl phosphate synthase n=1 Tax=Flavobacterium sp. TaxID=239 RepID=UPI003B9D543E
MSILEQLLAARQSGARLLAVLLDPEKQDVGKLPEFLQRIDSFPVTHFLVGGSTGSGTATDVLVRALKKHTHLPVILFPGSSDQLSDAADGLLFLSLLSGRNPEYLIGQHVRAAAVLRQAPYEVLATAYLLLDGGNESAVQRVSETLPLSQENSELIVDTAYAAQLLGFKLLYLEAGSGAEVPVRESVIEQVFKTVDLPLVVGGGIRNKSALEAAYRAGATMVVIGTAFEKEFSEF